MGDRFVAEGPFGLLSEFPVAEEIQAEGEVVAHFAEQGDVLSVAEIPLPGIEGQRADRLAAEPEHDAGGGPDAVGAGPIVPGTGDSESRK